MNPLITTHTSLGPTEIKWKMTAIQNCHSETTLPLPQLSLSLRPRSVFFWVLGSIEGVSQRGDSNVSLCALGENLTGDAVLGGILKV